MQGEKDGRCCTPEVGRKKGKGVLDGFARKVPGVHIINLQLPRINGERYVQGKPQTDGEVWHCNWSLGSQLGANATFAFLGQGGLFSVPCGTSRGRCKPVW